MHRCHARYTHIISHRGFSLVELLISLVIVSVLAAIAIPNYSSYVVATRRTDGMAGIMRLASSLEKFKSNCGEYTANILAGNPVFTGNAATGCTGLNLVNGDLSPDQNYLLAVVPIAAPITLANSRYVISATPLGAQLARDTECGVLTYSSEGVKTISGTGTVAACWKR